ncbi:MAG: P-loop NTPase [Candidatus Micrarchaeia archaeon]
MAEEQNTNVDITHPSFLKVLDQKKRVKDALKGIKHKIGIYSAKGGVGKTTVSVNLAFALKEMGYSVGILDADVDCPNLTLFLGVDSRRDESYPLRPLEVKGAKVISTAMYLDDIKRPIIWRGPVIAKMIGEFLENTEWGSLDYLIIDLPPGTSDAPLSIMQLLDLDGFVLVTTPQHIASVNAIRSGNMAKRLGIAILGVVENMSAGEPMGGKEVADALGCEMLGTIGKSEKFNEMSDKGMIPVLEDPSIKEAFVGIASKLPR